MLSTQILLQRSRTDVRLRFLSHATAQRCRCRSFHWSRSSLTESTDTSGRPDAKNKYVDKLQKLAEMKGVSLEALQEEARKAAAKPKPLPEAETLKRRSEEAKVASGNMSGCGALGVNGDRTVWKAGERRDNSPVKPLTGIMDVHRILRTPHTPEQVAALWNAFHASRSGGTGRGFLSATVPLAVYESLLDTACRFPSFVFPLQRESVTVPATGSKEAAEATNEQTEPLGYELFFIQWAIHPPPILVPSSSLFESSLTSTSSASSSLSPSSSIFSSSYSPAADAAVMLENYKQPTHPLATALFTPLLEYKARGTFATPYLVLTLYPELAHTHSIVLLRGELTPSIARGVPSSEGVRGATGYLLSQHDAQMLAHGMQWFYLAEHALMNMGEQQEARELGGGNIAAGDHDAERRRKCAQLLHLFNERPEEFKWEELLKHAHPVA